MVLVAGEAGVGKSRLAGRFADQASRAGTLVAVGGAAPLTGGALPYAPLLQALGSLADDHEPAAFGGRGVELAGMLAELAGERQAGEQVLAPEVGRGRLFERLRTVLGLLGGSAAMLLVLEDLHWPTVPPWTCWRSCCVPCAGPGCSWSALTGPMTRVRYCRAGWPRHGGGRKWAGWSCRGLPGRSWPRTWPR
jgi:hypothetical protein